MSIRTYLCAFASVASLLIALSPEVDARADASFAWHMVQHLLLLFVVPFFLLAAEPFRMFARYAPKKAIAGIVRASRAAEPVMHPVVALAVFVAVLWGTHFSPLYQFSLEHQWAHIGEHLLYLLAGTMFWAPVLAPPPLHPLPFPARMLYLFFALPQGALLSFALAGSHRVLYAHYSAYPNALADQANAAAVMWIAGGLVLFTAFLGTLGAWAVRESAASSGPLPGGTA